MKFLDKLKNVFFEEVEVDEEPVQEEKFAKKVEIPKKVDKPIKEDSTKKIENFSKKNDTPKRDFTSFEDDNDDDTDEIPVETSSNTRIKRNSYIEIEDDKEEESFVETPIVEPKETQKEEVNKPFSRMFEDDDFFEESYEYNKVNDEKKELYQGKKEPSYVEQVNNRPSYSYNKSYYQSKETKTFKPSPIISPIYGILDKNYRKEEVITKKEIHIASTYNKIDLDSVRNKVLGNEPPKETVKKEPVKETKKVYDVNKSKPQVSKVTLADADEYYNDLGLAYNVDYSDESINSKSRSAKYHKKVEKEDASEDNLFDLIDSMYNKED